jgi:hypothetical protein
LATNSRYQIVDAELAGGAVRRHNGGTLDLPLNLATVSAIPGVTHLANEHTNVKDPACSTLSCCAGFLAAPPTNFQGVLLAER